MIHNPSVTFIMPAYNVEAFIGDAVESILRQTVTGWKLTIIDDGSTDNTSSIASHIASLDSRIRFLKMERPSGSAYQPRKFAITLANSDFVSPLDADDWIEDDYLERLLDRQIATGADIVYPVMHKMEASKEIKTIPERQDFFKHSFSGRDCLEFTLDGWKINCNGGLIRRQVYLDAYSIFDSSISYSCADELLTRQLLLISGNVSFSDAGYFYRSNPDSITRKTSAKLFDFFINDMSLIKLTKEYYSEKSKEFLLANRQTFHDIFRGWRILNSLDFSSADKAYGNNLIDKAIKAIDIDLIAPFVSPRYLALLKSGWLPRQFLLKIIDRIHSTRQAKELDCFLNNKTSSFS